MRKENMGEVEEINEKRECTRIPFLTDVVVKTSLADSEIMAELLNISISGMLLKIDHDLPVGTSCTLEIRVAGNHSRLVLEDISGEVVRRDENGLAIHFTSRMEWFVLFTVYTHYCRQESNGVS
jgi:hypothetical protein